MAGTTDVRHLRPGLIAPGTAVLAIVAVLLAGCGNTGGDVGTDTPRSVGPGQWVAFDRGAFSADGKVAFIGVDDHNKPRVGRAQGGKPKGSERQGPRAQRFRMDARRQVAAHLRPTVRWQW